MKIHLTAEKYCMWHCVRLQQRDCNWNGMLMSINEAKSSITGSLTADSSSTDEQAGYTDSTQWHHVTFQPSSLLQVEAFISFLATV